MLYLNQLDYRHIHYEHNIDGGGVPQERRNIATSGCGVCSACMMVDQLTNTHLSIEECIRMVYSVGASRFVGTRMGILGPALADKFHLGFKVSKDMDEVKACLQKGGRVLINVGGDHDDYVGLYSHVGHYIIAIAYDGSELCILDPSYKDGKYEKEPNFGKVRVDYPFTYCDPQCIIDDTQNRETPFYLFWRK